MTKDTKRARKAHRDMMARLAVGPVNGQTEEMPMDGFPYADTSALGATSKTRLTGLQSVPRDMGASLWGRQPTEPAARKVEGFKRGTGSPERIALRRS